MQKEIISLGKLFVRELGLEPGSDTFSRWMAHYLAERMKQAESAKGAEKEEAERECFDVILKLWKHRWTLPNGRRPLENFEPIINHLQKLSVERDEPYFFPIIPSELLTEPKKKKAKEDPVSTWIGIAKEIDKVARQWIHDVLHQAAQAAKSTSTKEWLENAVVMPDRHDTEIIRVVLDMEQFNSKEDLHNGKFEKNYKRERIKDRLERLEKFTKLNQTLMDFYKNQLAQIEKGSST